LVANGTYLARAPSIPLFDVAPYVSILLQQDRSGSGEFLGRRHRPELTTFGTHVFHTKSSNQTAAVFANFKAATVPAGAPYNPLTRILRALWSVQRKPHETLNSAKAIRHVGFRGEINQIGIWEAGFTYNQNKVEQRSPMTSFCPTSRRPSPAATMLGEFRRRPKLSCGFRPAHRRFPGQPLSGVPDYFRSRFSIRPIYRLCGPAKRASGRARKRDAAPLQHLRARSLAETAESLASARTATAFPEHRSRRDGRREVAERGHW